MRYVYGITAALLLGGTAATLTFQPAGAQTAQNEPGTIAAPPRTWADDWELADPDHFGLYRPGPGKIERRDDPAVVHPDRPGAAADSGAAGRPEGDPGEDS